MIIRCSVLFHTTLSIEDFKFKSFYTLLSIVVKENKDDTILVSDSMSLKKVNTIKGNIILGSEPYSFT